jgi:hypothetical protein
MARNLRNLGKTAAFKAERGLRKAGEAMSGLPEAIGNKAREIDEGYSKEIVNMYMGPEDNPRRYTDNPILGSLAGAGAVFGGGTPMSSFGNSMSDNVAAVTGAAARYAAPAAGVAAAGKALMDLTVLLDPNEQTSGTLMP